MKTRRWIASSLSIAALLLPAQGLSQEPGGTLAIKAGRVHTWDSDLGIENGVVVIDNGIIVAVGGPDTPIPAGVEIIDAGDAGLFPGLFDAVSRPRNYRDRCRRRHQRLTGDGRQQRSSASRHRRSPGE